MADRKDPVPFLGGVIQDGPTIEFVTEDKLPEGEELSRVLSQFLGKTESWVPHPPLVTDQRFVLPIDPNTSFWNLVRAGKFDWVHHSVTEDQFCWEPGAPFVVYPSLSKLEMAVKPADAGAAIFASKRPPAGPIHLLHFMARFQKVEKVRDIAAVGAFSPVTGGALGIRQKSGKRVLTQFKSDELLDVTMYYLAL